MFVNPVVQFLISTFWLTVDTAVKASVARVVPVECKEFIIDGLESRRGQHAGELGLKKKSSVSPNPTDPSFFAPKMPTLKFFFTFPAGSDVKIVILDRKWRKIRRLGTAYVPFALH